MREQKKKRTHNFALLLPISVAFIISAQQIYN